MENPLSNSFFLKERWDLITRDLSLNPQITEINSNNWDSKKVLEKFHLNKSLLIGERIWDKVFTFPTFNFYSHSLQKIEKEIINSVFFKTLEDFDFSNNKSIKGISYKWANQYVDLINLQEIREEIFNKYQKLEEENLLSTLAKLDLEKKCEELKNKCITSLVEPEQFELSSKTISNSVLERNLFSFTAPSPTKFKLPLENSLPSMFLSYLQSNNFSVSNINTLEDIPKWIKKFNSWFKKWSISRYIPKERIQALDNSLNFQELNKQNVQWQDPEEKWFYYFLPLINLFFDKFREKYKNSLITTWEEPEYTFPLTLVDVFDTPEAFPSKDKPVFNYEGIPSWKIGKDLELIQSIIDRYSKHYEEQAKKELAEEGLAPIQLSKSLDSNELLNKLEKEIQEV